MTQHRSRPDLQRRAFLSGLAGAGAVGVAGCTSESTEQDVAEPMTRPTIDTRGSPGEEITIPRRGEVTLVEFFATTCGSCQEMMPMFVDLHKEYGDDVQFVAITMEFVGSMIEPEELDSWWREYDGNWPLAHDPGQDLQLALGVDGPPTTFIFDQENRIHHEHRGEVDEASLREAIETARE